MAVQDWAKRLAAWAEESAPAVAQVIRFPVENHTWIPYAIALALMIGVILASMVGAKRTNL